jgi:hypothetical protein
MRRLLFVSAAFAASVLVSAARGDDAVSARARALYQEGARLYNLGQYEDAVRSFEEAYAVSGAKPLLFNIAQAHRLAGPSHCERALRAYESYLREDVSASNREEVEERIVEMRACAERQREAERGSRAVPVEPGTAPPPLRSVEPSSATSAPIWIAGAGGVVLVAGAGLYTAARLKFDAQASSCPCPDGTFSTWQTLTTTSYVLLAVGGAGVATGLSWWLAARPSSRSVAISIAPSGAYVTGNF